MLSVKNKMFKRRRGFFVCRDSTAGGAATTLANAAAAGAGTVTLTSGAGQAIGARIRIGSGEYVESFDVTNVAGAVVTLGKPLLRDHDAGEPAVRQVAYQIARTTGGLNVANAQESTDVFADDQRLRFDKIPGYGTFDASTGFLGLTPAVIAFALGIPLSAISGTGADISNPRVLQTDFNDVDTEDHVCVIATHVLQDGTVRTQELWGVSADYTGLSVQMATGQPGTVPVRMSCYGTGVEYDGAPSVTADTSLLARKGQLWGKLTRLGYFADASGGAAAATTLDGAVAVGDVTITVADATGLAVHDFIMIDTDDQLEIHWIKAIAGLDITLKAPLQRAHADAIAVVKQTKTTFAAVTRAGATLSTSGTRNPLYDATRDTAVAFQGEQVAVSIALAIQSLTLENRALALGIPASAIVGNRLVVTERLGTSPINAVFIDGVQRGGRVNMLVLWGCAQDLANVATQYGGGQETAQPFAGSPSSGMQLLEYAA